MVRAAAERPAGLLPRLLRDGAEPGWLVHRLDELSIAALLQLRGCRHNNDNNKCPLLAFECCSLIKDFCMIVENVV